ncbi:S-layer-like y domain-containing protein, partial [Dysosmobacter welbionis]
AQQLEGGHTQHHQGVVPPKHLIPQVEGRHNGQNRRIRGGDGATRNAQQRRADNHADQRHLHQQDQRPCHNGDCHADHYYQLPVADPQNDTGCKSRQHHDNGGQRGDQNGHILLAGIGLVDQAQHHRCNAVDPGGKGRQQHHRHAQSTMFDHRNPSMCVFSGALQVPAQKIPLPDGGAGQAGLLGITDDPHIHTCGGQFLRQSGIGNP